MSVRGGWRPLKIFLVWHTLTYAPINVNPVGGGGGGVRARGGDLTAKSITSVGGLIEYLWSGHLICSAERLGPR